VAEAEQELLADQADLTVDLVLLSFLMQIQRNVVLVER
jgi:hypothetical protein